MTTRYLIVPYARVQDETRVLMARVELLQKRVRGKRIRGQVPDNAGQWTLIDGDGSDADAAAAAFDYLKRTTGVDLGNRAALSHYGFSAPRIARLQDRNYTPFTVLYLETNLQGLEGLAGDIDGNLAEPDQIADGVYVEVAVLEASAAKARLKVTPPPGDGWNNFILRNYYVTEGPGALDVTYPILVQQITQRSAMSFEPYAIALDGLPGGTAPPAARLVRLEVVNAEPVQGLANTYAANYDPGKSVTVRAVAEPPEAAQSVVWSSDFPAGTAGGGAFTVPLGDVTAYGTPGVVTATLGAVRLNIGLIIRPVLDSFKVTNAEHVDALGEWIADCEDPDSGDTGPIEIAVKLKPDTPNAYGHLQWSGDGDTPKGRENTRLVPRKDVTDPSHPLKVRAAVNPWWDFVLFVLPRLRQIDVVGANVYNPAANNWQVDFQPPAGACQVRVTTWPNIAIAHQMVTWSTGAIGVNQIPVNRFPIDNVGPGTAYTASIRRNGVTLRQLTANVLIQPTLANLFFDGPATHLGPAGWYSYDIEGHFNLPAGQAIRVVAQTNPNNLQAWGHLQWQNTDGPGATLDRRVINLNAVRNLNVGCRIGAAPQQVLPLDIRNSQAALAGALHLQVAQVTFAGAGIHQVAHDEPGNVGPLFTSTWALGMLHANQDPLAYTRNTSFDINAATINILAAPAPGVPAVTIRATAFVPRRDNPTHPVPWGWAAFAVPAAPLPPGASQALGAQVGANLPNEVVHADPLLVFWEMQIGAGGWMLFDVTTHMLYVTLGNPVGYLLGPPPPPPPPPLLPPPLPAAPCYFTPLAVSCQAAHGENTANGVVAQMFTAFRGLHAATGANAAFARKRVVGNPPFTYWNPQANSGQGLVPMLNNAAAPESGTCRAWAEMFIAMGAMHGINTLNFVVVVVNPVVSGPSSIPAIVPEFLVRNWTFNGPTAPAAAAFTHDYLYPVPPPPLVLADKATPVTSVPALGVVGLAGQNNPAPPPSFVNHFIVRYTGTGDIYDPSYGSGPHANRPAWVNAATDGLWKVILPAPLGQSPLRAGFARAAGATDQRVILFDAVAQAVLP